MSAKRWSYGTGRKGVNRIRVYEREGTPVLQIEWHDASGRHREPIVAPSGAPVTDQEIAKKIADVAAAAQLKARNAKAATELLGISEPRPLIELLKKLHDQREKKWKPTYRRDQERFRRFWTGALGAKTPIQEITPAKVESTVSTTAEVKGWEDRTQQAYLRYIIDAFSFAQRKLKWISEGQNLSAVEIPKADSESKPYSVEEMLALLPKTHDVDARCAAAAEIAFDTQRRLNAIRNVEVIGVRLRVVEEREVMFITFPGEHDKARRTGTAALSATARRAVERLLETQAVKSSGLLFPSGDLGKPGPRKPIDAGELIDMLHRAEELAGVPHVKGRGYHGIKRRAVTMGGRAMGMGAVSKQSGTNRTTLERIYDQDDPEPKADLAEAMEGLRGTGATGT